MNTFRLTYDRHKGKYGYKEKDFPKDYAITDTPLDYACDPDWSAKGW